MSFLLTFLTIIGAVMQSNFLVCRQRKVMWRQLTESHYLGLLSRDNFLGDICLQVIVNGQLFTGAIAYALGLIVQGQLFGGEQLSRGKLSWG